MMHMQEWGTENGLSPISGYMRPHSYKSNHCHISVIQRKKTTTNVLVEDEVVDLKAQVQAFPLPKRNHTVLSNQPFFSHLSVHERKVTYIPGQTY